MNPHINCLKTFQFGFGKEHCLFITTKVNIVSVKDFEVMLWIVKAFPSETMSQTVTES